MGGRTTSTTPRCWPIFVLVPTASRRTVPISHSKYSHPHYSSTQGLSISAGPAQVTPLFGSEQPPADCRRDCLGRTDLKAEPRLYSRLPKTALFTSQLSLQVGPRSSVSTLIQSIPRTPAQHPPRAFYIPPALRLMLPRRRQTSIPSHTRGAFALQAILPAMRTPEQGHLHPGDDHHHNHHHHYYNYDRCCSCTPSAPQVPTT